MNNAVAAKDHSLAVSDWHTLKEQATFAWKSGILPKSTDTAEKAITIALYGRELGLPILTALNGIYIVNGMVTIKAALMLRLIYERVPGAKITILVSDTTRCEVEMQRPGNKPQTFCVTMAEMNRAGVTGKQVWKSYPDTMLRWAAIRTGARIVFADAIAGVYLEDEAPNHDPKEMEVAEPKLVSPAQTSMPAVTEEKNAETEFPRLSRNLTDKQIKRLWAIAKKHEWTHDEVTELLRHDFNTAYPEELTRAQYDAFCSRLENNGTLIKSADEIAKLEAANYVIPFGRHKGTRLGDIPLDVLRKYMDEQLAALGDQPVAGIAQEFMGYAELLTGAPKGDELSDSIPF